MKIRLAIPEIQKDSIVDGVKYIKEAYDEYVKMRRLQYLFIEKQKNKFKSLRYVEASHVSINTNTDPIFKDITYMVNGKTYETCRIWNQNGN